mmetsp:Transcript_20580/g.64299  ORF Transcript_20580/g.64299 Transcript_20580/m.64299 type:complete len:305 (-) Transcript_20580:480-1394(-)
MRCARVLLAFRAGLGQLRGGPRDSAAPFWQVPLWLQEVAIQHLHGHAQGSGARPGVDVAQALVDGPRRGSECRDHGAVHGDDQRIRQHGVLPDVLQQRHEVDALGVRGQELGRLLGGQRRVRKLPAWVRALPGVSRRPSHARARGLLAAEGRPHALIAAARDRAEAAHGRSAHDGGERVRQRGVVPHLLQHRRAAGASGRRLRGGSLRLHGGARGQVALPAKGASGRAVLRHLQPVHLGAGGRGQVGRAARAAEGVAPGQGRRRLRLLLQPLRRDRPFHRSDAPPGGEGPAGWGWRRRQVSLLS